MNKILKNHIISENSTVLEALSKLNLLKQDAIIFVVNNNNHLLGSITDGDIRRGLIKGISTDSNVLQIIQPNPKFIRELNFDIHNLIEFRDNNYKIIPVINNKSQVVNIINFRFKRSYLPIDIVLMAGGKGSRLMPLTKNTPKPLLKVGSKPIIEHNIDRLILFGIENYWISLNYLADQVKEYFGNGQSKSIKINYVLEDSPLGTIGAVSKINEFCNDYVLVTNSDILTNLDYEKFFLNFVKENADFSVVTIPYEVKIPYAVIENNGNLITDFKEKPTYRYYSNGGIYLIKKSILKYIPKEVFYNSTDLMEELIKLNKKVISYPFSGYWLDIGKHDDYKKAQSDLNNINFGF